MSSQQHSTLQDSAKFVRLAVLFAWIAGFLCASAMWVFLTDSAHWIAGGTYLFFAACLTLFAYVLMRAAVSSQQLQDGAKFVRLAVLFAWPAGFVCASAMWDSAGHGIAGGIYLFAAACLTLSAYLLTRTALNSRG